MGPFRADQAAQSERSSKAGPGSSDAAVDAGRVAEVDRSRGERAGFPSASIWLSPGKDVRGQLPRRVVQRLSSPGRRIRPDLRGAGLKFSSTLTSARALLVILPGCRGLCCGERPEEGWQVTLKVVGTRSLELVLDAVEPGRQAAPDARGARFDSSTLWQSDGEQRSPAWPAWA